MKRSFNSLKKIFNERDCYVGQLVTRYPLKANEIALISQKISNLWDKNLYRFVFGVVGDLAVLDGKAFPETIESMEKANEIFDLFDEMKRITGSL